MNTDAVSEIVDLDFPWVGMDPFIFTVHHLDEYPEGNEQLGPKASLADRNLGMDFSYRNGWSMYHGDRVPGFPMHPHRGFETVTVVRRGYVDHSDSLGATARYGQGDTQWLTTGSGIMHAEMFPLLDPEGPNPLELFQIWLNLPPDSKLVDAHFAMLWGEDIPVIDEAAGDGRVRVEVFAGPLGEHTPPTPPPDSWAANPQNHLAIWVIELSEGAEWILPGGVPDLNRMLHCVEGEGIEVGGHAVGSGRGVRLASDREVVIRSGSEPAKFLLLQGRPIGAPVIQMGPFVMTTPEEIQTAISDFRRTQFGGWPWGRPSPVHDRAMGRFAIHADGRRENRDLPEKVGA